MAARYKERVGGRIRKARLAYPTENGRPLSQSGLARMLPGKVDGPSVSRWERGLVEPRADTLEAIADALGVDVSFFYAPEPEGSAGDLMGALRANGNSGEDDPAIARIEKRVTELGELVAEALRELRAARARPSERKRGRAA